jgi:hypothetical protein
LNCWLDEGTPDVIWSSQLVSLTSYWESFVDVVAPVGWYIREANANHGVRTTGFVVRPYRTDWSKQQGDNFESVQVGELAKEYARDGLDHYLMQVAHDERRQERAPLTRWITELMSQISENADTHEVTRIAELLGQIRTLSSEALDKAAKTGGRVVALLSDPFDTASVPIDVLADDAYPEVIIVTADVRRTLDALRVHVASYEQLGLHDKAKSLKGRLGGAVKVVEGDLTMLTPEFSKDIVKEIQASTSIEDAKNRLADLYDRYTRESLRGFQAKLPREIQKNSASLVISHAWPAMAIQLQLAIERMLSSRFGVPKAQWPTKIEDSRFIDPITTFDSTGDPQFPRYMEALYLQLEDAAHTFFVEYVQKLLAPNGLLHAVGHFGRVRMGTEDGKGILGAEFGRRGTDWALRQADWTDRATFFGRTMLDTWQLVYSNSKRDSVHEYNMFFYYANQPQGHAKRVDLTLMGPLEGFIERPLTSALRRAKSSDTSMRVTKNGIKGQKASNQNWAVYATGATVFGLFAALQQTFLDPFIAHAAAISLLFSAVAGAYIASRLKGVAARTSRGVTAWMPAFAGIGERHPWIRLVIEAEEAWHRTSTRWVLFEDSTDDRNKAAAAVLGVLDEIFAKTYGLAAGTAMYLATKTPRPSRTFLQAA